MDELEKMANESIIAIEIINQNLTTTFDSIQQEVERIKSSGFIERINIVEKNNPTSGVNSTAVFFGQRNSTYDHRSANSYGRRPGLGFIPYSKSMSNNTYFDEGEGIFYAPISGYYFVYFSGIIL